MSDDLNPDLKKSIISYCYSRMARLNDSVLKDNRIRKSDFMELLYMQAVENAKMKNSYKVSEDEMEFIFKFLLTTINWTDRHLSGDLDVLAIQGDENIIYNEKINNNK